MEQQWRHTGSVAGAPPVESESNEGCKPGWERDTPCYIAKGNGGHQVSGDGGVDGKAAGAASTGIGTASGQWGRVKTVASKCRCKGRWSPLLREGGPGQAGRSGCPVTRPLQTQTVCQCHNASTEDVRRFREKESQLRVLAERLRGEVQQQQQAWDRQAHQVEGRREAGRTRAEVKQAVMRGPRSEGGLITSSLRGQKARETRGRTGRCCFGTRAEASGVALGRQDNNEWRGAGARGGERGRRGPEARGPVAKQWHCNGPRLQR